MNILFSEASQSKPDTVTFPPEFFSIQKNKDDCLCNHKTAITPSVI